MAPLRVHPVPRYLASIAAGLALACAAPASAAAVPAPGPDDAAPTMHAARSMAGFPNARNTGARGSLRLVDRDRSITRDGTVLQNVEIHGSVTINADDVTLRNVKVVSDGYWPVRIVDGRGVKIVRSTIVGTSGSQASVAGTFVGRRLNISGAGDGVRMDGGRLVNSYIHDLADFEGAHNDGIEAYGPVRIVHNTVLVQTDQTSAIMLSEYGDDPDTNVLVKDNLIGGGGYSLYGGAPDTARGHVVVDNLFTTRFFPRSGSYGPVAHWRSRGNVWENNRWADGPRKGGLVRH